MGFVKNKYIGRTVGTGKNKKERLLQNRITALKAHVQGKRVIVIDDSIVRGETSKHIVRLLHEAGAKEVHMLIYSPPFKYPCYYGMDMKKSENFIANKMTVDELKEYIGADTLGYISIKGLRKIAENANIGLCDGCFSGNYDAEVPEIIFEDKYAKKIKKKTTE
jgi:amidophosphoribosyltransferase